MESKIRPRLNSISGPTDDKPMPEARVLVLYTGGTVGMKCKHNGGLTFCFHFFQ